VEQSLPNLFCRTHRCRSNSFPIVDISIRSGNIHDRSLNWSEILQNVVRSWPHFLGEEARLWDLNYKTEPTSDYVAKFHADRLSDLGNFALKKRHQHEERSGGSKARCSMLSMLP